MEQQSKFLNRELSWLRFNSRVLTQCQKQIPPIEKLKFVAIYSTNLDEFYMIRVAGLKQLFTAGVTASGDDEMTPLEQLREIRSYLKHEQNELEAHYIAIKEELSKNGLFIKNYDELTPDLKLSADEFFFNQIMPVIIPIAVDATHPFPHLNNLSFSIAVKLCDANAPEAIHFGMIRIPRVLPRFVQVAKNTYVTIDSIVNRHAEEIFPGYKLISSAAFRVTRNADIVIEEEEADDFMMILEAGLKLRRKGAFVRLQIAKNADPDLLNFLNEHLKIFYKDIFECSIPLTLDGLWEIAGNKDFSYLAHPQYLPKTLPPFNENTSVMSAMEKDDILIFHPYESFDPVQKLIKEASKDPKVISIRMTLYRVEKNSPIVQSLIEAASDGKQVTVMVELKARFDEENNLHWAKALEDAGAHVIYGIAGFKVHAKVTQIIKKEDGKLKFYIHLGTGNYNGSSAKIYTDVSFFTCGDTFDKDTTNFFHILSGYNKNRKLGNLSMSPMQIKERILKMIKVEESKGSDGRIIAKMNALVDSDMIKALYKASQAGVKIDLIIRGICCLRPGVAGLSENIKVRSIIGKYLEHARIFYFKHAEPCLYIASADWMPRNLERRLELMTPIYSEALQNKLKEILKLQLSDTELAYELGSDGEYSAISVANEAERINNHEYLEIFFNKIYKSARKHDDGAILATKLLKES
ncbi:MULTISPECIES: RNA degradosome polyphosphate kinase [unclassified Campylobacter]|nr:MULTISPECIES: RNA degradosome polyphosphate kinase [unclassified Campylobacter]MDA3042836.1 RNA degradosome polyphosphate kinase [Campylobacter sp. JMF_09 ED2]MDA3044329.1 RNA degradosome polyphosphate kinase [Campylobacter sp. JMF_07 ED4]MDA3054256.1 RNA degradosome polyphosphate kinase [Campylobacter sp. VBCF_07 NA4]MDA3060947.1 RNA degradosome polyphosphate kinase [Campylobacter sp. VBCF_02 NA5]MDA3063675.1 RNA degradosome polyphosphate kinase [Campylobacter sp. JMF_11 EL3]